MEFTKTFLVNNLIKKFLKTKKILNIFLIK